MKENKSKHKIYINWELLILTIVTIVFIMSTCLFFYVIYFWITTIIEVKYSLILSMVLPIWLCINVFMLAYLMTCILPEGKISDLVIYINGERSYKDHKNIYHLVREDGRILASGNSVWAYSDGRYVYEDLDGIFHLMEDGVELCKGVDVYSRMNGDYEFKDEKGVFHLMRDGKEIAQGLYVNSYINGDYEYTDENGNEHIIKTDN